MKSSLFLLTFIISQLQIHGQNSDQPYSALIKVADSLYNAKDYLNSTSVYSAAFKIKSENVPASDRYNAACTWALANIPDSAFYHLNYLAKYQNYTNYGHITIDPDLVSLYKDHRWDLLIETIKMNKEKAEATLIKPLVQYLENIYQEDQKYRLQVDELSKKYSRDSKEMQAHWKLIQEKDSLNLIKIKNILDYYGWLGEDDIGRQGNTTLFLVIQHADLATQEKYLPMMRDAVKNKKANPGSLALLEDRVALRQGKKQIYGSQIGRDPVTNAYYVSPLEDPDNVDKRRAEVGLSPLADYVNRWQIKWDVEQYKKDLPDIEAKENAKKK
jgi:hypothetical protein